MHILRKLGLLRGLFRRHHRFQPSCLLELYSMEGCPACRRVRHVLTELDIDFVHRSCPKGSSLNRVTLNRLGGRIQVPFLVDRNTGVSLYESRAIVAYLEEQYGTPSESA